MRTRLFFRMLVVMRVVASMLLLVCAACDASADCSCAVQGVTIASATQDLVGASGCGHAASCATKNPCNFLLLPPPADGGVCTVGILFADGGTKVVSADFGALHHSTDCCGDYFDQSEITIGVQ